MQSRADGATSGSSSSSESSTDDSVDIDSESLNQSCFLQLEEHSGLALSTQTWPVFNGCAKIPLQGGQYLCLPLGPDFTTSATIVPRR
jgi:hypothetical protein